jgi:hypothetical protein
VSVESYLLEQLTFANHDGFLATLAQTQPERQFFTLQPAPTPHRLGHPLAKLTVEQLRELARDLAIEGRTTMSKSELIEAIRRQTGGGR